MITPRDCSQVPYLLQHSLTVSPEHMRTPEILPELTSSVWLSPCIPHSPDQPAYRSYTSALTPLYNQQRSEDDSTPCVLSCKSGLDSLQQPSSCQPITYLQKIPNRCWGILHPYTDQRDPCTALNSAYHLYTWNNTHAEAFLGVTGRNVEVKEGSD